MKLIANTNTVNTNSSHNLEEKIQLFNSIKSFFDSFGLSDMKIL